MTEYPKWQVNMNQPDWREQAKRHDEQVAQWYGEQGMLYSGYSHPVEEGQTPDPHKLMGFDSMMTFKTAAEADAAHALFPKFVKVKRSTLSIGSGIQLQTICCRIWFAADGVNKGKNETGQKRMAKFLSIACATFKMSYRANCSNAVDVLLIDEQ